ncbi:MAG: ATP-dependent RecD-like DNA helicase [Gammaproteobacteria bacterium]|jgi:exodeoxyribonuclease V alpha subunit|nr:ATP-dependent RecD-like DNA helicase [Gammaproteobacteria bacterium]
MKSATESHVTLSGRVHKVIFSNAENGYTVLQLQPKDKNQDKITVVGYFAQNFSTEQVTFHGHWQEHPLHGRQFMALVCEQITQSMPMEKFLVEYIDGVGPSYAKKIIDTFGDEVSNILNNNPERLKEVPGIGQSRLQQMMASWQMQKSSHEVVLFLTSLGLHFAQAARVAKRYGNKAKEKVEENPYRLIEDIDGIGFQTADNLALKLGMAVDSPHRIQGAFLYLLQQATRDGHCGVKQENLIDKTIQLLNVSKAPIEQALEAAMDNESVIIDSAQGEMCVFLPTLYTCEKLIALGLKNIMATPLNINDAELEKTLNDVIQEESLPLTDEQQQAAFAALQSKVFVLTGGPGVGKTTLIKILLKVFMKQKMTVALAAPTGRAAKRISESTGHTAKTIHRLLEYDPYTHTFAYHPTMPLPFDVIILDEASMLDVPLCSSVVQALGLKTRIIFVGDIDQLSAVGPGDVLKSLISSGKIPYFPLKTIFRQAASSQIIVNAHRVNSGLMPQVDKSESRDFFLIRAHTPEEQQQKIIDIVTNSLPSRFGFSAIDDIQLLSPMNGGPLGVDNLNVLLQEKLNPPEYDKKEMKHLVSGVLREEDKVIQIVNNYEKNIFNGDVGKIISIDNSLRKFVVLFDKQKVEYQFKELEQLRLAYAISVHKSQGSEYPAVVVTLSMSQRIMLKRNLLYTAITRGKSCVVVIGEPEALSAAIKRGYITKRVNKLEDWLKDD